MAGGAEETGRVGSNGHRPVLPVSEEELGRGQLDELRADVREILELVRSLVALLLPKGSDDGPKLEDLIAALVAQQRDILVATRQVQADVLVLLERSGDAKPRPPNGRGPANGTAQT